MSIQDAQRGGVVVGLRAVSGVQLRRELDDLMTNDPDVFNLFILALAKMMEASVDDKMGYFRIAGIHGLPRSDWDNIKVPGVEGHGSYCTHGSYLFPSWHRPYLAMMEQTLYHHIESIAGKFTDLRYEEAAKRFRMPYWDWIKPRAQRSTTFPGQGDDGKTVEFPYNYDLPEVLTRSKLNVYKPGRDETTLVLIDNPLLTYYFPGERGLRAEDWKILDDCDKKAKEAKLHVSRTRTVRSPSVSSEVDDFESVSKTLNMLRESSVEQVLDLISSKYDNYLDFASEKARWKRDERGEVLRDADYKPFLHGPHGSLEDIHNRYHDICGGSGHMGRVPVAAFDPIFFLHHCNIDRIFSVWQATHDGPNSFLPDGSENIESDGSPGHGKDVPLWPFRSGPTKDDFWTSAMVKDPKTFGYTYFDTEGEKEDIFRRWDASYRWSLQSSQLAHPPEWMKPVDVKNAPALMKFTEAASTLHFTSFVQESQIGPIIERLSIMNIPGLQMPEDRIEPLSVPNGAETVIQWYIDTQVERDALDDSFTIFYFVGDSYAMAIADRDPASYSTAPILAGLTKVFTAPREACGPCRRSASQGVLVTGTSAITPILRDYINTGLLEGLNPAQVLPFLEHNLHFRVVTVDRQRCKPGSVRGLRVGVSANRTVVRDGILLEWQSREFLEVTAREIRKRVVRQQTRYPSPRL